jgi:hypothetical protein
LKLPHHVDGGALFSLERFHQRPQPGIQEVLMPDLQISWIDIFASTRARLISALVIVALAPGIIAEVIAIRTSYFEMRIKEAEAKNNAVRESLSFDPCTLPPKTRADWLRAKRKEDGQDYPAPKCPRGGS